VGRPHHESGGRLARSVRGVGARSSFGWQRSIGRIARLVRWEVARPRGDKDRALARRKSEAPPDAGHGWREGETVREHARHNPVERVNDLRVSACRVSRRLKALSGFAHHSLTGVVSARSSDSQVNVS